MRRPTDPSRTSVGSAPDPVSPQVAEQLALLETILHHAPVGFAFVDRDYRYVRANEALAVINRTTVGNMVGNRVPDVVPKLWRIVEPLYARAMGGETIVNFEVTGPTLDPLETTGHWMASYYPIRTDGLIVGVGVIVNDITELKTTEAALRESETRFRTLIEDLDVGVILQDSADRILVSNRAACRILGLTQDELLGVTSRDPRWGLLREDESPLPPDHVPSVMAARMLKPIREAVIGVRAPQSDSRVWVEVNATPRLHSDGTLRHVLVTLTDITERRRLELQVRQAQKMEAIGQLAGGVAHDFNNLITIIAGYAHFMSDVSPADSPFREYISEIIRATERSGALTQQLLAFSRRQVMSMKVIRLNDVIAEIEQMLRRALGETVTLVTRLDPGAGYVKADPGQLSQVLMNMALNARDAMPAGGKLLIESAEFDTDGSASPGWDPVPAGRYSTWTVSDTGVGMSPDMLKRIFDPFFTTKPPGKGTGLGLSVAEGIVRQSGGLIQVRSEPGNGSTFRVILPAVSPTDAVVTAPAPSARSAAGTETILLVEDEKALRSLAAKILRDQGYLVLEAKDARHATRLCAEHPGDIHMLLTDVVMPGESGRLLAERLSGSRPSMKVLYISGYTDDAVMQHGIRQQSVNFLRKPFEPADLIRHVADILRSPTGRPR